MQIPSEPIRDVSTSAVTTHAGLVFHSIPQKPELSTSSFSQKKFAQLIHRFAESKISGTSIENHLRHSSARSSQCVLTFDDGFENVYENALPILRKHDMTATVFAVAGSIGQRAAWDVFGWRHHMTGEQLRSIVAAGFEVGSHTLTHADLTFLDNKDLQSELTESKNILEQTIGKAVTTISFPFGKWNDRVWHAVQKAGYLTATIYRGHTRASAERIPVTGVYAFESVEDIAELVLRTGNPVIRNLLEATHRLMPQFSQGTALWNFRKNYHL